MPQVIFVEEISNILNDVRKVRALVRMSAPPVSSQLESCLGLFPCEDRTFPCIFVSFLRYSGFLPNSTNIYIKSIEDSLNSFLNTKNLKAKLKTAVGAKAQNPTCTNIGKFYCIIVLYLCKTFNLISCGSFAVHPSIC